MLLHLFVIPPNRCKSIQMITIQSLIDNYEQGRAVLARNIAYLEEGHLIHPAGATELESAAATYPWLQRLKTSRPVPGPIVAALRGQAGGARTPPGTPGAPGVLACLPCVSS